MGKVVFSGHGGFETNADPPLVTVPNDTDYSPDLATWARQRSYIV